MPRDLPRSPLLVQVLSLYLLLLAFFILLNNIASVEAARNRAVAGSLKSTFAGEGRPTESPAVYTSDLGNALSDAALEARIGLLVRTEIGFAELNVIEPGRVMELALDETRLFRGEGIAINPVHRPFVERIARVIGTPPHGVRYDTEILLAGPVLPLGGDRAVRADEPAARAAFLASVLIGAGAPARNLAAGVEPGNAGTLRLLFHVRPQAEDRLFSRTGEATEAAP